jgi:hypothetical protein
VVVPVTFSAKILSQPEAFSCSSCTSRLCPTELTRAYPTVAMTVLLSQ